MKRPAPLDALRCARLFWLWLLVRTLVWVGAVVCTQPNAPLDLVEWSAWGNQLAWGCPKHPPLTAWVAGVFASLSPGEVWGTYLAGYLFTAVCLWAAWQLGREFLPPNYALLAAVCLDGLIWLTGDAAEFSNNVVLNAAWALTVLFFVRAVRTGHLGWWLTLGGVAGLGLLAKYTLAVLLLALAGYLVCDRSARQHLRRPGPYLAALLALALFAPHAVWLVRHDFITLHYATDRAAPNVWAGRLKHPVVFLLGQLLKLAPVLVIVAPVLRYRRADAPPDGRAVLHWAVAGPVALLLAISAATGCQLRDIWGSPLGTFVGVWLLAVAGSFCPARLLWSGRAWAVVGTGMLAFCAARNVALPYLFHRPTRVTYPGRPLAEEVARRWYARCTEPFPIVAGEAWRAGNVCCYAPHRPKLYSSGVMGRFVFDPKHVPWCDDAELAARGGVILWDAGQIGDALPYSARERFPSADVQPPIILPYQTGAAVRPDRVGVAFIWPESDMSVR